MDKQGVWKEVIPMAKIASKPTMPKKGKKGKRGC
jgi:hypothetical protein